MSYRVMLTNNCGFDVDVENKINGIEFSNIKTLGNFYVRTDDIRMDLLLHYIPQYSTYNLRIKSERTALAKYYKSEIDKLYDKIEEYKLVIQLCTKNKLLINGEDTP